MLPPQQLGGPGSHWGRRWPGPTAPAPPSPLPPLPPGGRRRLGGPPTALQAAATASPVPAPPSRGGSDVRSPRVPGRGERGRQCRGRQATASREHPPDGKPSAGEKGLSWGRAGGEGRSVRSNPQTPSRTSSPLSGLPPPPGARDLGCGGAAGVWGGGQGRLRNTAGPDRTGGGRRAGAEFGTLPGDPTWSPWRVRDGWVHEPIGARRRRPSPRWPPMRAARRGGRDRAARGREPLCPPPAARGSGASGEGARK